MKYKYIGPRPNGARLLNLAGTYSFNVSFDTQVIVSSDGLVLNPSSKLESIISNDSDFLLIEQRKVPAAIDVPVEEQTIQETLPKIEEAVLETVEAPKRKGGRPPKSK